MARLSHLDSRGRVRMVDVSAKRVTTREAVARGIVFVRRQTLEALTQGRTPKGNVLATAHLAAVMAAKRTSDLIPLAHAVPVDAVDVLFDLDPEGPAIRIETRVRTSARTGVEMEALTAVAAAALTFYDMLKAIDRGMVIGEIALWQKRGGRTGEWKRAEPVARARAPKAARPAGKRVAARRAATPRGKRAR